MKPKEIEKLLAELKFELDSLYVGTEIIQSRKYKERPIDGLLYEACLLHFRVVWDIFYGSGSESEFTVREFLAHATIRSRKPKQDSRLREIRSYLNVMLAHLSRERIDPKRKAVQPQMKDIALIRQHTETLFNWFVTILMPDQRKVFVNPLGHKFVAFKTLNP